MKRTLLTLFLAGLLIAACTSAGSTSLVGTWRLVSYGPKDAPSPAVSDANASLTFGKDSSVGGSGGCNSLGGSYEVDGEQINFSEITMTLMACDDTRMAQEGVVTQVLTGTAQYEIEGNKLTLTNDDQVLVFTSAPGSYPASYPYQ